MISSTSNLIKKYGLNAKKSLGQNFILDKNFTDKIARAAGDLSNSIVLEIGPGPGSLTRSILDVGAKKLIVVEKDERCLELLNEFKNFYGDRIEVINGDALEFDFWHWLHLSRRSSLSRPGSIGLDVLDKLDQREEPRIKIISNLPYNIGTVLLFKWLKDADKIESMHLMLQKEVVERIVSKPGDKHYGRLAVMVNFLCETRMVFEVSRHVFTPPPKVTSAIVEIIPREKPLADVEFKKLEKLVAAAFNQRRKMLKSSLKAVFKNPEEILMKAEIRPDLRPENLRIEDFCRLAQLLA